MKMNATRLLKTADVRAKRNEAKENGLARYSTGSPCSKGHTSDRYVSTNSCIACLREWEAIYRNAQKAKIKNHIFTQDAHAPDDVSWHTTLPRRPGIYSIVNSASGKIYVGSAINIRQRLICHRTDLKRQSHCNSYLQHAWNKYGKDAFKFSVVENVNDTRLLIEREQHWIDALKACGENGYNLSPTAGNCLGTKKSEQAKAKMRGRFIGRFVSAETRQKQSASAIGRHLSEEAKAKLRAFNKGKVLTTEHRQKISISHIGKTLTKERKQKLLAANIGRTPTEETKQKMSAAQRRRYSTKHSCDSSQLTLGL